MENRWEGWRFRWRFHDKSGQTVTALTLPFGHYHLSERSPHFLTLLQLLLARAQCNDLPPVPAHLPQNYILTGPAFLFSPTGQFTLARLIVRPRPIPQPSRVKSPKKTHSAISFPRPVEWSIDRPERITFDEKLSTPAFRSSASFGFVFAEGKIARLGDSTATVTFAADPCRGILINNKPSELNHFLYL